MKIITFETNFDIYFNFTLFLTLFNQSNFILFFLISIIFLHHCYIIEKHRKCLAHLNPRHSSVNK
jgi:hypothetical protein